MKTIVHAFLCALAALFFARIPCRAQQLSSEEVSCLSSMIASVPSRPTVSNGAQTTQCGVVEVEYGFDHQWQQGNAQGNDFVGGLRFGLTPDLDFHWASTSFLSVNSSGREHSGFGDSWLGLKYRIVKQTKYRPDFGIFYQAKLPSADERSGLGTGEVDHSISFLISKDLRRLHFDFNVIPYLAGRSDPSGYDHNVGFALSAAVPVSRKLSLVEENYGYTTQNPANPAFASSMTGVCYEVRPRFYMDGGVDLGVTSAAPPARVYFGVTYAIANLYRGLKRP